LSVEERINLDIAYASKCKFATDFLDNSQYAYAGVPEGKSIKEMCCDECVEIPQPPVAGPAVLT